MDAETPDVEEEQLTLLAVDDAKEGRAARFIIVSNKFIVQFKIKIGIATTSMMVHFFFQRERCSK